MKKTKITLALSMLAAMGFSQSAWDVKKSTPIDGTNNAILGTENDRSINFRTNDSTRVVIDSLGNFKMPKIAVGPDDHFGLLYVDRDGTIGTMNTLDVAARQALPNDWYPSKSCYRSAFAWYEGGNLVGNYSSSEIGTCNDRDFILKADDVKFLFLKSATTYGNSYIGMGKNNSSPTALLDLKDELSAKHTKIYGDVMGTIESTGSMNLHYNAANAFQINSGAYNSANTVFNIISENVGIGFGPYPSSTKLGVFSSGDGIQSQTDNGSAKALSVYNTTSSSEQFFVKGDGTTKIGHQASAPNSALLNVNVASSVWGAAKAIDVFDETLGKVNFRVNSYGYVYCRELHVKIGSAVFPDFVFEKEYKLMPLKEREAYVKQNKHLPNVIGVKEIKEDDVAVGEVMTGILQNTEELTLYVFELNKKLEKISAENADLKSELSVLKSKLK